MLAVLLEGVSDFDEATPATANAALDENVALFGACVEHLEVEDGVSLDTHSTCHLLSRKDSGRGGVLTGGTGGSVGQRGTVGGVTTFKVPLLHHTGKTLTLCNRDNVDKLSCFEVVSLQLLAKWEQVFLVHDLEVGEVLLRGDLGVSEVSEHRLRHILGLLVAGADLNGVNTLLLDCSVEDNLVLHDFQHGGRETVAVVVKETRHAPLDADEPRSFEQPATLAFGLVVCEGHWGLGPDI